MEQHRTRRHEFLEAHSDLIQALGRRITAARALAGMKVEALSAILETSPRTVYRLERGKRPANYVELHLIARATGQPMSFFFGVSNEGRPIAPHLLAE